MIAKAELLKIGEAEGWVKRRVCAVVGVTRPTLDLWISNYHVEWPGARSNGGMVRLSPEHAEALRQAAFDLAAKRRIETTGIDVLEEFISETLATWLNAKLATP
jgi:hypothetical protein